MKRILDGVEIEMTESEIAEFEQSRVVQFNIELFKKELAIALDEKFETYWKVKGYEDITDLLSHNSNTLSPHHSEAKSLIQWWHNQWESATAEISESSDIERIINNLKPYNG